MRNCKILYLLLLVLLMPTGLWAADVVTDTTLYPPGGTVQIAASGYLPYENVKMQVTYALGELLMGTGKDPWFVTADAQGDLQTSWAVPYGEILGDSMIVWGTGDQTAPTTSESFVYSLKTNFDQLQNGTATVSSAWALGNINSSNACYSESRAVAYRYFITGGEGSTEHFFTIRCDWTKAGIHGIDYLVEYDHSEAAAIAAAGGTCGTIATTPPPDCQPISGIFTLPDPTNTANYSGSIPPDFFPTGFDVEGTSSLAFYNGTVDSVGPYYFTGTSSALELNFEVYFTITETASVGFYWGGHLAQSTSSAWGAGNGAGFISGAPIHMATVALDNQGNANKDRSINESAIYPTPDATITCSEADSVCTGDTITCSTTAGAQSYTWSVTGGTILTGQGTNSVTIEVTASYPGQVTIGVEVCDGGGGCPDNHFCASEEYTIDLGDCCDDPVATCPGDTTIFACDLSQICLPGFDCNGTATVTGGTLNGNEVCFTPLEGANQITLICTNECGEADTCVTTVTVTLNSAPVCSVPDNSSFFQCDPTQVCLPVSATDVDANLTACQVVAGPGTVTEGNWCYTPTGDETVNVTIRCTDDCGLYCEGSFAVTFEINDPPQITCPADVTVACDASTDPANTGSATATDDNDPAPVITYTDTETAGACAQEKSIARRWKAVDNCGDSAICVQTITVTDDVAPVITCPADAAVECGGSIDPTATGYATATDNCDPAPTVTYSDSQVGNTITRTWTATDDCGNSAQCVQIITVEDTTPPTITCPTAVTVQCIADIPPVNVGSVTASDDCDPTPVVTHISDVSDNNTCPEVITRTYRATDASGNWAECTQTITIDDTIDPVITCPANVTISCEESIDPGNTGSASATDNCTASPTVTFSDSEVAGTCPQEKVITRTWTATDDCGNSDQCVQTITVEDNTPPVITCPADITIDCTASTDPSNTGTATATDNCDPTPTVTYADNQAGNVITRTWTATDDCGNSSQCVQTITITDTTPPTITCPTDASVQCPGDVPPVNTGSVTVSDDCDPSPVVTHIGDVSDGYSCPEVITRTYRATDASGNWAECAQTITIDDTIDPVITCPADVAVDCGGSIDPAQTGSATATDNCDPNPAITYSDNQVGNVITRTWTATDDCGNAANCAQIITIADTTPPTVTCPADVSVQCAADLPPVSTGSVTASDDCDPSPVVTHIGDVSDGNSCPEVITRTYRATDASGNWAECTQTITIDDTVDPAITCPASITISCEESTDPSNTGSATATDNCTASPAVTFSDTEVAGACPQEKVITRTWTATDDCGNTANCQQTITVEDNDDPVITCPADVVVNCTESSDPPNTGTATATDNCDTSPTVTYADNQVGNVITRTWTAVDDCGNSANCQQTITVSDTAPPTVTCPTDAAVQCSANLPPVNTGAVTASDDCDPSPVVTHIGDVSDGYSCPEVITRTYRATDASGNWAECAQTITIDDTIDPVITCPADVAVDCGGSIDPSQTGSATATDNCDPSPLVTYSDNQVGNTITRTWTAEDDCSNTASCQQTITIADTTPPTVTCPMDVSVQCSGDLPPVDVGSVTATDDCDPAPVVTHIGDVSDNNSCPEVITRTYRATDASGNWDECTQTITIDDTVNPAITCPANVTISCEESTDPGNTGAATATDNCTASPTVTFSDTEVAGACPQEKVITRTWTATDDCGNLGICVQTITVEDDTPPIITCPADMTIDCTQSSDPSNTGTATATDNCDPAPVITYSDNQVGNVITRTWTAEDDCGNTASCDQMITITDTTPPTVTCPTDVSVQCVADLPPVDIGSVTASDDCDPAPVVTHIGDVSDGYSCPEVITRTYRATDATGNFAECTQTITLHDTERPVVTCAADITVSCEESTDPSNTGFATATDNCTDPQTVSYSDTETPGNCPQEKIITRTWTAVDDCVNITECTQIITVIDEIAPVITCPADIAISCEQASDPEITGYATATDNCDPAPVVTYSDATIPGARPYLFEISRIWTATDECGNSAECTQLITAVDTTPPVITCPADLQLDCDDPTDPGNTGTATAVDNCDPSPTVIYSDNQVDNVITRTWTATDADGNSSQCQQIIEVGDGTPPVCSVPADQTMFRCGLTQVSLPVSATHDAVCEVISGPGTISGGNWIYTPTGDQTVNVVVRCTDACDLYCEDDFSITFEINEAPSADVTSTGLTPFCGPNGAHEICIPFSYADADDNITDIWVEGDYAPLTVSYADGDGQFCFTPPAVDAVYNFTVYVRDDCDALASASQTHTVAVDEECDTTTCIVLDIEDTECVNTGSYAYVDIMVDSYTEEIGGFDLLIAYDASAFTFTSAEIGSAINTWEYFTYRMGPFGNCGGPCPSGLLRVIGIADINNGPNHPDPAQHGPSGVLVTLIFRVTSDQTMAGYVYNVYFYWIDCGDNGVSSVSGDTLFVDKLILNSNESVLWNEFDEVNYPEIDRLPNVGTPDVCMLGDKTEPRRCVVFINGSICIIHPDSIDAVGDVNLNGTSHEIADAVLFTNYIIHGLQVFTISIPGQLAATDVNHDGIQGSVGDLVYLIRVITGDALPYGKLAPFVDEVAVGYDGSVVSASANRELGAMLLTFKVEGDYELTNLTEMSLVSDVVDGELKVLLYDFSTKAIPANAGALLRIEGEAELVKVEVADYHGNNLVSKLDVVTIPDEYGLTQNYPNPFNPSTVIEFALPQASEVSIEVYNIAGQKVATVASGQYTAGYHRVSFEGRDEFGAPLASGIYFYRLTTTDFVETRKMLLVK